MAKKQAKPKTFEQAVDIAMKTMSEYTIDDIVADIVESSIVNTTVKKFIRTKVKALLAARKA